MEAARQEFHRLWGGPPTSPAGQRADALHAQALEAAQLVGGNGSESAHQQLSDTCKELCDAMMDVDDELPDPDLAGPTRPFGAANVAALLLPVLRLPHLQRQPVQQFFMMLTDWEGLGLGLKVKVLKRLASILMQGDQCKAAAHCPRTECQYEMIWCLVQLTVLTDAERLRPGRGLHAKQEGVRLRLALAQHTSLLPFLAGKVAAAAADEQLEAAEPYATRAHVAACALLGAFSGSINHTDVEADWLEVLKPLSHYLKQRAFWRRYMQLVRAPRDWLAAEPAGPDDDVDSMLIPVGSRRHMLEGLPCLLFGDTIPIAQAFEAEGGFGILDILKRPEAADIMPWLSEMLAEALDIVHKFRAYLPNLRCTCCQEKERRRVACSQARREMKMCEHCERYLEEVPGGLKCCSGCKITRYCSAECQRKDWKRGHNKKCAEIAEDWQKYQASQQHP